MLVLAVNVSLALIGLSIALALVRFVRGPRAADRMVSLGAITVDVVVAIALVAISKGSTLLLDAVLVVTLLGFIGTVAFAKFLGESDVID